MSDIPLAEAQVIWDSARPPTLQPAVKVIRLGEQDDREYFASWGACNLEFREADDRQRLEMLFKKFHELTVGYRLDPQEVHSAFLDIPEYRSAIHEAYVPAKYSQGESY